MIVDPKLKEYEATPLQCRMIDAVNEAGGFRAGARLLGYKNHDVVRLNIRGLEKRAARLGYAPGNWESPVAPGYVMGKVTVHRRDGGVVETWERQHPELADLQAQAREILAAMKEEIPPAPAIRKPRLVREDLLTQYTVTDYHLGMRAAANESDGLGADWDLDIAEDLLVKAILNLASRSPDSGTALLVLLGDLLHFDGPDPVTPTHKHPLDASARQRPMLRTVVRAIRRVVDILLTKHQRVDIVVMEGNHDLAGTPWLQEILLTHYENHPRVTVSDHELPFFAYRFGVNFLGFHHGHQKKKEKLPLLFAAMFRELWGLTRKGYIHTGHFHEQDEKEHPGVKVIQHPTMAAPDSHTLRHGYMSEREMSAFHYHIKFGAAGRDTVTPEMLEAA